MMGKRKPDQVITHRIELQESERATLEAALAGRFVSNIVTSAGSLLAGAGALLKPFEGAITAIAAIWLADKTIDQLKAVVEGSIDAVQSIIVRNNDTGDYQEVCAWFEAQYSLGGWDMVLRGEPPNGPEYQSAVWRQGYYDTGGRGRSEDFIGPMSTGTPTDSYTGRKYWFLIDRFDQFIFTMKNNPAGDWETQHPCTLWMQFYPWDEYENEILWYIGEGRGQYQT